MKRSTLILLLFIASIVSSCGIYSFTGASIPPGAKTVTVKYFQNNAPIVQPTLAQTLTEKLQTRLSSQTSLSLVDKNGDLFFEGSIVDYTVMPIAMQANETAAKNRLTVTVNVKFTNKVDPKLNYDSNFTEFADYNRTSNVSQTEEDQIVEALIDKIFNKAVVNW